MNFIEFSEQCQYYTQRMKSDEVDYCHRENSECIENNCPLWESAKTQVGKSQVDTQVMRRLAKKWNTERDRIWDEWQWCLEHKLELEAKMKYELKEQLERKIFELEDIIEGV